MSLIAYLTLVTLTLHIKYPGGMATCTGVYISPNEALTASHCVDHLYAKIWVKNSDNKSFSATVENKNKNSDLCLLKINGPAHKYAELGKVARKGDHIYTMSSEEDMPYTYGEGIVANTITDPDNYTEQIVSSISILPGASGSGLFDDRGLLVGINTMKQEGLSFATDLNEIEIFLNR